MLLLALERMGIRKPSVYVAASRAAQEATGGDPNRAFWVLAQLQGSLAVIARLRIAGHDRRHHRRAPCCFTVGRSARRRQIRRRHRAMVRPRPRAGASCRRHDRGKTHARLERTRQRPVGPADRLGGPAVPPRFRRGKRQTPAPGDAEAGRPVHGCRARSGTPGGTRVRRRQSPVIRMPPQSCWPRSPRVFRRARKNALPDTMAPGVSAPPPPRERIDRVLADLERMDEVREPDRAARATQPLVETADTVLAEALLALAYAVDIGDPDGTALLASNIAMRHDFGFMLHEGETRARRPWDVPRQDFLPDVPWHVTGSLLGLDIALAPLSLKHIDLENLAMAPRLRSTEREAFALNAALLDASRLNESDRTALVAAVERGRTRVAALPQNAADVDPVADAVRMDGWRRRTLKWTIEHEPARVPGTFSLVELMTLGGDVPAASLDAWGLSAYLWTGCVCTRMPAPGGWRLFEGRPQLAYMSFIVSDLNLRDCRAARRIAPAGRARTARARRRHSGPDRRDVARGRERLAVDRANGAGAHTRSAWKTTWRRRRRWTARSCPSKNLQRRGFHERPRTGDRPNDLPALWWRRSWRPPAWWPAARRPRPANGHDHVLRSRAATPTARSPCTRASNRRPMSSTSRSSSTAASTASSARGPSSASGTRARTSPSIRSAPSSDSRAARAWRRPSAPRACSSTTRWMSPPCRSP